ncbi:hypothetical protein D3C84_455300 [compost metagenome]
MWLLQRFDRRERTLDVEVFPFEVERLLGGPGVSNDFQVFIGALVAFGLVQQEVAFLGLGRDAGNGVQANPPTAGGVIERRESPSRDRRGGKARAVGDHEAQALGVSGGVGGDLQTVSAARTAGDQHPVEAGMLMGSGMVANKLQIEIRAAYTSGLGPLAGENHAYKFNGHWNTPDGGKRMGRGLRTGNPPGPARCGRAWVAGRYWWTRPDR